jgi:hypothetical protein
LYSNSETIGLACVVPPLFFLVLRKFLAKMTLKIVCSFKDTRAWNKSLFSLPALLCSKFTVHGSRDAFPKEYSAGRLSIQPNQCQFIFSRRTIRPSYPRTMERRSRWSRTKTHSLCHHSTACRSPPILSPRNASEDNSNLHHTQEANLPKSFRRSIFDILKRKSPYRPVPNLDKEDAVLVPEVNKTFTDRVRRVNSLKATTETAGASCPRTTTSRVFVAKRSTWTHAHRMHTDDDSRI